MSETITGDEADLHFIYGVDPATPGSDLGCTVTLAHHKDGTSEIIETMYFDRAGKLLYIKPHVIDTRAVRVVEDVDAADSAVQATLSDIEIVGDAWRVQVAR